MSYLLSTEVRTDGQTKLLITLRITRILLFRHGEVSKKLSLLHLESLAEAKIEIWMDGKAEVELVDMVLR